MHACAAAMPRLSQQCRSRPRRRAAVVAPYARLRHQVRLRQQIAIFYGATVSTLTHNLGQRPATHTLALPCNRAPLFFKVQGGCEKSTTEGDRRMCLETDASRRDACRKAEASPRCDGGAAIAAECAEEDSHPEQLWIYGFGSLMYRPGVIVKTCEKCLLRAKLVCCPATHRVLVYRL